MSFADFQRGGLTTKARYDPRGTGRYFAQLAKRRRRARYRKELAGGPAREEHISPERS